MLEMKVRCAELLPAGGWILTGAAGALETACDPWMLEPVAGIAPLRKLRVRPEAQPQTCGPVARRTRGYLDCRAVGHGDLPREQTLHNLVAEFPETRQHRRHGQK